MSSLHCFLSVKVMAHELCKCLLSNVVKNRSSNAKCKLHYLPVPKSLSNCNRADEQQSDKLRYNWFISAASFLLGRRPQTLAQAQTCSTPRLFQYISLAPRCIFPTALYVLVNMSWNFECRGWSNIWVNTTVGVAFGFWAGSIMFGRHLYFE